MNIDPRCLNGTPVPGAYAHICVGDPLPYDDPAVQQARRDVLAWWIPLLGADLVCLSTVAADASRCAGAVTVARDPRRFAADPFVRLFAGRVVGTDEFCAVPPPTGPVIERYAGAPWPGGGFGG